MGFSIQSCDYAKAVFRTQVFYAPWDEALCGKGNKYCLALTYLPVEECREDLNAYKLMTQIQECSESNKKSSEKCKSLITEFLKAHCFNDAVDEQVIKINDTQFNA